MTIRNARKDKNPIVKLFNITSQKLHKCYTYSSHARCYVSAVFKATRITMVFIRNFGAGIP